MLWQFSLQQLLNGGKFEPPPSFLLTDLYTKHWLRVVDSTRISLQENAISVQLNNNMLTVKLIILIQCWFCCVDDRRIDFQNVLLFTNTMGIQPTTTQTFSLLCNRSRLCPLRFITANRVQTDVHAHAHTHARTDTVRSPERIRAIGAPLVTWFEHRPTLFQLHVCTVPVAHSGSQNTDTRFWYQQIVHRELWQLFPPCFPLYGRILG